MNDHDTIARDDDRFAAQFRFSRPYWYKPASQPCEHVKSDMRNVKRIAYESAYSDGGYYLWQCKVCSGTFSTFDEG